MRSCFRAARRRTSTDPAREPAASRRPVTTLRGGIVDLLLRGWAAAGRSASAASTRRLAPSASRVAAASSVKFEPAAAPSEPITTTSRTCGEISVRSAIACAASIAPSILARVRRVLSKFFADRGTHLAAMIAYFALLSLVPLLFLALALLGLVHQADQNSFFVRELSKTFPDASINSLLRAVRAIQANATALGIVGGAFLLWSALSFFSVLESAFNIVYGRPNRGFLHGKALATMMMVGSLVALFVSLVIGSIGQEIMKRYAGFAGNATSARVVAIVLSGIGLFVFLASAYYVLTNADLTLREVLPGAITAAVILEATFQLLPVYVNISKHNPVLQTLSGPAILLVWLYVMANVIVLGAEVNWWRAHRALPSDRVEPAAATV